MAQEDTRRWLLRNSGAGISNTNIPTLMLVEWARRGIIKPGCELSADGNTWVPAETLPELELSWYILAPGKPPYGPVAREAAERFIAEGHFPREAVLSQDPGAQPVSMELPLPMELPPEAHLQELEETRKKLVLLERELRLKDKRIDELRMEAEARQAELDVGDAPDAKALASELESLRLAHAHLKESAQEAAEASAEREQTLRQRLHALETALETAQKSAGGSAEPPDATLFSILSKEASWLQKGQEEETHLLEQLRELVHRHLAFASERLLAIRRLAGDSPEQMVSSARDGRALPAQKVPVHHEDEGRVAQLEKALAEAREHESALQRQLIVKEGNEAELRSQIGLAERRTLNALELDTKLQETARALERERAAREDEHRENAHIQEQLLRRIEELERTLPNQGAGTRQAGAAPMAQGIGAQSVPRSTFGWLRKR